MKKKPIQFLGIVMALLVMVGQGLMPIDRAEASQPVTQQVQNKVVNINRADAAELETVRGIGPVLAQRILDFRKANGEFKRLDDLMNVPGIGASKFEKIKAQITV